MSDEFWIRLQLDDEANKARETLAEVLAKIHPWMAPHAS